MYKADYKTARFHVEFGPKSLFERVLFKMKDVTKLYLDGKHFCQRLAEREIPADIVCALCEFDIRSWTLKMAEVRIDRGKFVNTTWEKEVDGHRYQVTIGMGQYVKTIVDRSSSGIEKCIRNGELYNYVSDVNSQLMQEEREKCVEGEPNHTDLR